MIIVCTGENNFEIRQALTAIERNFDGAAERIDGQELELRQLPDLLMGTSLFSKKRLIIIKNLSDNKTIWPILGDWLPKISDDITLVLIESKPDKRTKTYKDLQKIAELKEFKLWGERDVAAAATWLKREAKAKGVQFDDHLARLLVHRVGVDQWQLAQALDKLSVLAPVDKKVIETVIDAQPSENVFQLFELALRGESAELQRQLRVLRLSEDPYRVFGLLSGQAFQLVALVHTDKASAEVAKDIGAHPFVISKLTPYAKKLGTSGAKKVILSMVEADTAMKTSVAEPWLLIERALIKIAAL